MTTRSRIVVMLWEIWRVTRTETAWKLAIGMVGGLAVLALCAALGPTDDPRRYENVMDNAAAIAMTLLVVPHLMGWLSFTRFNGGRPGFPLSLHYTRPVRTAVMVGVPVVYLTAVSTAIYLASALLLRVTSGYAFPLLPVAVWMAGLNLVWIAATWSARNRAVQVVVMVWAITSAHGVAMARLTGVEVEGTYDWPPRLWPTLFDFPNTDYAWIALIGLASIGVTVAGVARQRRGQGWVEVPPAQPDGFWERLVSLFRFPCPTSSATRAQLWLDLKSNGFPVVTIGMTLAIVILLVSAVANPIDAAFADEIRASLSCSAKDCFAVRAMPVFITSISLPIVLLLGGNAFGVRRRQGRTYVSAFEVTHAHGTARLAALKVLVKSVCVLASIIAIGVSVWISVHLLGDAVFIQMWNVPLRTQLPAITGAIAALTGTEQLSLVVLAAVGLVIWVAAIAALGAVWIRYSRRATIAASSLLLSGLALGLLALAGHRGMVSPLVVDAVLATARWTFVGAMVLTTVYVSWSGFAERVLTVRYASGVLIISAAFAAAWLTVLQMAGVQLAGMSALNVVSILSPAWLPLMASVLAPWSLSRIRHT